MRQPTRWRDIDAGWVTAGGLVALCIAGLALTAVAARIPGMPLGLAPFWLASGLAVGPGVRWGWARTAPAVAAVMMTGAWLGGDLDGRLTIIAGISAIQCAIVSWTLRRSLPRLMADRRPIYRVRLAHLARFLFAATLPASLLAGVLVAILDASGGVVWASACHHGLLHAAASALSIAVLAPLMWWDQLRAVSWPAALCAALVSAAMPALAASDARLLWLAPVVVLLAGYLGSTWSAVLAVACMGGGLLLQSRSETILALQGPEGFMVWLLMTWRLLGTGLLASLWSDRRGGLHRRAASGGQVHATAMAAWRRWRALAPGRREWLALLVDRLLPEDRHDAASGVSAGGSLKVRGVLDRLALRVRHADRVIGVGPFGALVLVQLEEGRGPDPEALRLRCRQATHPSIGMGRARRLPASAVALLVASAAYLDQEPVDPMETEPRVGETRDPVSTRAWAASA